MLYCKAGLNTQHCRAFFSLLFPYIRHWLVCWLCFTLWLNLVLQGGEMTHQHFAQVNTFPRCLDTTQKNSVVYRIVSEHLKDSGCEASVKQCSMRTAIRKRTRPSYLCCYLVWQAVFLLPVAIQHTSRLVVPVPWSVCSYCKQTAPMVQMECSQDHLFQAILARLICCHITVQLLGCFRASSRRESTHRHFVLVPYWVNNTPNLHWMHLHSDFASIHQQSW